MPEGPHPFPSRTRKLSPPGPMVLRWQRRGRVGRCRGKFKRPGPRGPGRSCVLKPSGLPPDERRPEREREAGQRQHDRRGSEEFVEGRFVAMLGQRKPEPGEEAPDETAGVGPRSEERRVGKECRSRWWPAEDETKVSGGSTCMDEYV